MNKVYKQKNIFQDHDTEKGWTIDYNILIQVHQEVNNRSNWLLGLEEVEQVILALIELNYLKLEDKEN